MYRHLFCRRSLPASLLSPPRGLGGGRGGDLRGGGLPLGLAAQPVVLLKIEQF